MAVDLQKSFPTHHAQSGQICYLCIKWFQLESGKIREGCQPFTNRLHSVICNIKYNKI